MGLRILGTRSTLRRLFGSTIDIIRHYGIHPVNLREDDGKFVHRPGAMDPERDLHHVGIQWRRTRNALPGQRRRSHIATERRSCELRHGKTSTRRTAQDFSEHTPAIEIPHPNHRAGSGRPRESTYQRWECDHDYEIHRRGECREDGQRGTGRGSDCGGNPNSRGSGQATDSVTAHEDEPRPQEPDSRNDLGCHTGRGRARLPLA